MRSARATQLQAPEGSASLHLWSGVVPGVGALAEAGLRTWALKLLRRLSRAYAVRLQGFAFVDDQFHLVLQWAPEETAQWSEDEVANRWRIAHPPREVRHRIRPMDAAMTTTLVRDSAAGVGQFTGQESGSATAPDQPVDTAKARRRLASLSAFLQLFKQLITFKANRESHHHGTIWRGRFKMAWLADASALAGALSYIDLLPAAKGDGARPEESPYSSLHARVALYKGKFGATPYEPLAAPDGYLQPFPPEVAAELREDEDPMAGMGGPMLPVDMPPPMMPGVPMDGMGMGGMMAMGGMGDMGMSGTPLMPMPMPEPAMPQPGAFEPRLAVSGPWVGAALREDGPGGALSWLSLRQYLRLLDALLNQAKTWPHMPCDAPGRAPKPATPDCAAAVAGMLVAMGLQAAGFAGQWRRMAGIRG